MTRTLFIARVVKEQSEIRNLDRRDEDLVMPTIPFRMRTAELLVKLQKFKSSVQILETVIEEDDEYIEAWYLLALCFCKRKKW